jgi:hypothetical protein
VNRSRHLLDCSLGFGQVLVNCDQDQLFGFVLEDGFDCVLQFSTFSVQGGQDDGDILGSEGGVLGNWDWSKSPERNQVDNQADVAVEAVSDQCWASEQALMETYKR